MQVMLGVRNGNWETGELDRPLDRGVNFMIPVDDITPLLNALASANVPLFEVLEVAWHRARDQEIGQRRFLVRDRTVTCRDLPRRLGAGRPHDVR